MFRRTDAGPEVLLVHPGGPFWRNKDAGAWTIPKGEVDGQEDAVDAARREFSEETGLTAQGELIDLGAVRQPGGKIVHAWGVEGDCDASAIRSNTFSMVWPPKSGKLESFPEIDRAEWFTLDAARIRILQGQQPFLDRLAEAFPMSAAG
jgi:predicted NUDIX family NTP pyrophosphohydrolase